MKKNNFLLVFFTLLFLTTPEVFGQVSKSDIDKAIDQKKLVHPYLYFSEEDKPSILERMPIRESIERKIDSGSNMILSFIKIGGTDGRKE